MAEGGGATTATSDDIMESDDNNSNINFLTQEIPDGADSWCESVNTDASDMDDGFVPNEVSRVANEEDELLAQPTDAVFSLPYFPPSVNRVLPTLPSSN